MALINNTLSQLENLRANCCKPAICLKTYRTIVYKTIYLSIYPLFFEKSFNFNIFEAYNMQGLRKNNSYEKFGNTAQQHNKKDIFTSKMPFYYLLFTTYYSIIPNNSTSKISVENGPKLPISRSP